LEIKNYNLSSSERGIVRNHQLPDKERLGGVGKTG